MKQHQGIWLPDHEKHLVDWMNSSGEIVDGRGTYQIKKLRAALTHVRAWRCAVDVGAHVGFWSMHMVKRFLSVYAFEPVPEHRECWEANVRPVYARPTEAILMPCALGNEKSSGRITIPPGSSGGAHVELFHQGPGVDVEIRRLDEFELQDVDFLKIDCEGFELAVLEGAAETLKSCRPCVIVEQKAHIMAANFGTKGTPAVDFMIALGAKQRAVLSGDYVLTWDA